MPWAYCLRQYGLFACFGLFDRLGPLIFARYGLLLQTTVQFVWFYTFNRKSIQMNLKLWPVATYITVSANKHWICKVIRFLSQRKENFSIPCHLWKREMISPSVENGKSTMKETTSEKEITCATSKSLIRKVSSKCIPKTLWTKYCRIFLKHRNFLKHHKN